MLTRIAKYSLKNILRNKFLSLSSVLVLTLLMLFINILVVLHDVSFKLIDWVNSKLSFSLYLNDDYDKSKLAVTDFMADVKKIDSDIQVQYKQKQEILEEIRLREPDLAKILERTNPLPNTIVLSDIPLSEYEIINNLVESKIFLFAQNEQDDNYFANYNAQYDKIQKVISVLGILQFWLYIVIWIFLLSISVIIYSIIGNFIYYYRDEIYITRLVGGSKKFIYGPFVIQGGIYSLSAFFISFVIFMVGVNAWHAHYINLYQFHLSYMVFLTEMIVFVGMWALAGYFSSKKYLK